MKHTSPEVRDPAELRPHSILNHIPAPAKDAPEVCACANAIREQDGHLLPLIIDETNQILTDDSRLRWMAAKRMGMDEVPVTVQPGALAPVIALNAITHRAHYTKSAVAYLAVPMLKDAFEAARAHRLECLKQGKAASAVHSVHYGKTWEIYAGNVGICRRMLANAVQVHREFDKDKTKYRFEVEGGAEDGQPIEQTLREHFEPKILRQQVDSEQQAQRPIGLGGVMKAIGSIRTYVGLDGKKPVSEQLELFTDGLATLRRRLAIYANLSPSDQRKAREAFQELMDVMPDDLIQEAIAAHKRSRKGD